MTLRMASLRIDPVARSLHRPRVRLVQGPPQGGECVKPTIPRNGPAVLEDHPRGRGAGLKAPEELRPEGLDARVADVVEEVKVIDEARRLLPPEPQQRVDATGGGVHH